MTSRLSYANVMATVAMFVALGGSGYAAVSLSSNSVGSKQIKNGQVKTADIANNAVTSPKVKNGSLLAADFKAGQLPAGVQGPKGDSGAPGTPGAAGLAGSPGVSGLQVVSVPYSNPKNTQTLGSATCPAGKSLLAGGVEGNGDLMQHVNGSWPQNATTWKAHMNNTDTVSDSSFTVYAVCGVVAP